MKAIVYYKNGKQAILEFVEEITYSNGDCIVTFFDGSFRVYTRDMQVHIKISN